MCVFFFNLLRKQQIRAETALRLKSHATCDAFEMYGNMSFEISKETTTLDIHVFEFTSCAHTSNVTFMHAKLEGCNTIVLKSAMHSFSPELTPVLARGPHFVRKSDLSRLLQRKRSFRLSKKTDTEQNIPAFIPL